MKRTLLLVAGFTSLTLGCFSQAGMLDPSYASGGRTFSNFLDINKGNEMIRGMAVQTDGKIVAVGSSISPSVIFRYNGNGTPDNSFNGDGKAYSFGFTATS